MPSQRLVDILPVMDAEFVNDGYIRVYQDARGRNKSEGEFVMNRPIIGPLNKTNVDESTDAYDTIDWLVKNIPNNNGNVGMFGISYPGFYTSMGMIDSHPALKAASPQAPIADWFMGDDLRHNGAFFLSQNFGFFYWFELKSDAPMKDDGRHYPFGTPDGYDFYLRMGPLGNSDSVLLKGGVKAWTEFLAHDTYDSYWQARNIRPHLRNVHCAVMTVGGWFDGEDLFGWHVGRGPDQSADFFDAERFPEIVVDVTGIAPDGSLSATLTIRGTTLPLPLAATVARTDAGAIRITARGEIDRTRWGVSGNMLGMMPPATTLVTEAVFTR